MEPSLYQLDNKQNSITLDACKAMFGQWFDSIQWNRVDSVHNSKYFAGKWSICHFDGRFNVDTVALLSGHHIDHQRCRFGCIFIQGLDRITQITALEKLRLFEYCIHHHMFSDIYCCAAAAADTMAVHAVLSPLHPLHDQSEFNIRLGLAIGLAPIFIVRHMRFSLWFLTLPISRLI